jgi:hypothetical protein
LPVDFRNRLSHHAGQNVYSLSAVLQNLPFVKRRGA